MEKTTGKKREWIKNIAIIFLSILLVLTFFSNTIMNYSLPQVATEYVESGTISNKIRGSGVVEAVDPYKVMVDETRTIKSVALKVASYVEKGDVLYYLEDLESEELQVAQESLDTAQLEYEKLVLNGGISATRLKEIQAGKVQTLEQSQSALSALQTAADEAENKMKGLEQQIALLENDKIDATAESKALANAQIELNNAKVELAQKQALYDSLASLADDDEQKKAAQEELAQIQEKVWKLEAKVANAQIALELKLNSTETAAQIAQLQRQKIEAETVYAQKKGEREELLEKILLEIDIASSYSKLEKLREEVEKLKEKSVGASIVSPVSGKILSMNYVAGEKTEPGTEAAVIQVDGKGMMLTFSIGVKQANVIRVGDPVEVQNMWYYGDVTANLTAIKSDPNNPRESRVLVFNISGEDVIPGDELVLSVGQRSMNYDLIVSNTAIREDNNGKFILIVESKSAPFGNRYVARRIDVEVLASDDTKSAIKGLLEGYEYVITTSTKPIKAGDQIRFAEGMN